MCVCVNIYKYIYLYISASSQPLLAHTYLRRRRRAHKGHAYTNLAIKHGHSPVLQHGPLQSNIEGCWVRLQLQV